MDDSHNIAQTDKADDGSLAFLNIPKEEGNKHFNCRSTTQQKLTNLTFWVCDYDDKVKTRYGEDRCCVFVKHKPDDRECDGEKFFTNSGEIKYVLRKIHEMDAFPRRVTLRASGTRYYFE